MPEKEVLSLPAGAGDPSISIHIGYANWGTYKVHLWDPDGTNPQEVFRKLHVENGVAATNTAVIGNVAALDNHLLSWKLRTIGYDGPGNQYYMEVNIIQNGQIIKTYPYGGELEHTVKTVGDYIRLRIV